MDSENLTEIKAVDGFNSRTQRLVGEEGIQKLSKAAVAVFGVGGVGGYVCEALARAGVGKLFLVDKDTAEVTNLNRQITALHSSLGKYKTLIMKERIADINPLCRVLTAEKFYPFECDLSGYDYVADCIDNVTAKLVLIENCKKIDVPIISCMGTGNKIYTDFKISDISKTSMCPLAKVMRRELKKRGISHVKCVFSEEQPKNYDDGLRIAGTLSYVPGIAGLNIAGEIIRSILQK